jgi:hypothetical protein
MIAALFSFRYATGTMTYTIRETNEAAQLDLNWQNPAWLAAETLAVSNFRPESSAHRPQTLARLLHDQRNLHGIFQVHDRFVRSTRSGYGSEVWKDACVEFFIEPKPSSGYFNFEFNCGGAFLCNYIVDPTRTADFFKQATRVPEKVAQVVTVHTTLPSVVDPEVVGPVTWALQFSIPLAVLEAFVGPFGKIRGQTWRGNFFKCAEDNSHPHWASWSPVDEFNFHLPRCFGEIRLA